MTNKAAKLILLTTFTITVSCFYGLMFIESETVKDFSLLLLFVTITLTYIFLYTITIFNNKNPNNSNMSQLTKLSHEYNLLYDHVETIIQDDINVIKSEITQIKCVVSDAVKQLTESFYEVSRNAHGQQHLVNSIINAINKDNHKNTLLEIQKSTQNIKEHGSKAVRSLQFEDIVIQVADNGLQYTSDIEIYLHDIKNLLREHLDKLNHHHAMISEDDTIVNAAQQVRNKRSLPDRKAAYQQNMTEGGIELF